MTPGFTGADLNNLVNQAISDSVHEGRNQADMSDFEVARDRIIMGIERKKAATIDRDRICTAIHEAGHALTCITTEGARDLYKATIVQ